MRSFLGQLPFWGKGADRQLSVWWWEQSLGTGQSSSWLLSAFCSLWFKGEGQQGSKPLVLSKWYLPLPITSGSLTWLSTVFCQVIISFWTVGQEEGRGAHDPLVNSAPCWGPLFGPFVPPALWPSACTLSYPLRQDPGLPPPCKGYSTVTIVPTGPLTQLLHIPKCQKQLLWRSLYPRPFPHPPAFGGREKS